MALFGFFKKDDGDDKQKAAAAAAAVAAKATGAGAGGKPADGALEFSPAKANSWFERASTMHESGSYEYAMTCWLSGLRFDPANVTALEGFFKSAAHYRGDSASKAPDKDIVKAVAGKTPVDRYLSAVLNWACKPSDSDLALRAAIAPAELGLSEPAKWIGPKALNLLAQEARPKKDAFIKLMAAMAKFQLYDIALRAGEIALKLDPTDIQLGVDVKNMAAQATMSKGGYGNTGEAGGFRGNIRDASRQQNLDQEGRMVRNEDAAAAAIEAATAEHLAAPTDKVNIRRLVEALVARGTPSDEKQCIAVLEKAFADTQEYSFRRTAGDFKMKIGRRTLKEMREKIAAGDAAVAAQYEAASAAQIALELGEYQARAYAYPTDLGVKYELAVRYIEAGKHNEAIEQLQHAKSDGKNKIKVLLALGRAFVAIGWPDEAVDTFHQALEGLSETESSSLELRYELMCALQLRAERDRDLAAAEEASSIASKIAQQQFGYRDVRARREAIKTLITALKS